MANRLKSTTDERESAISSREPSQSRSATVEGTRFGNYANIHQGDQHIEQSSVQFVNNYYGDCISSHPGSDTTFASHGVGNQSRAARWTVPFGRSKEFIGRESALDQLLELIVPDADKDDCQKTVIQGLGGVGKTQVALEAAFRVRDRYKDCHVFWVPAIDATTFENAYRQIGQELHIPGIDNDKADVKSLVKAALSKITDKWLLIIDNADDADLFCSTTKTAPLKDSLPFSLKGSILFTTRNDEISQKLDVGQKSIVRLTEMSRSEAIDMLQKNLSAKQTSDTQSMESLLDFLTDLPLAIKQASAYMAKTGMLVTQYLAYCSSGDERLIELLSKDFEDRARYKDTRNPVATTWLISFRDISRNNPLAAKCLQSMSVLAEKNIPKHLLPHNDNELEIFEAIGLLKAYAFVNERADGDSYDIHRLVRLVMRNWLAKEGGLQTCVTTVMQRFSAVYPDPDFANKNVWTRYLPHALIALEFQEHSLDKYASLRLLYDVSRSILLIGRYNDAEQTWRQTVQLCIKFLGEEHPYTLASKSNLAKTFLGQGKCEKARQIHQQTLELRIKLLGADHPDTLLSRTNIANTFYFEGQYEAAGQMYQQIVELQKKVLGPEHERTLLSMYDLASVLYRLGQHEKAIQVLQETLELRNAALGSEYHDTLFTMHSLAVILFVQGQYTEAEQMFQKTLELQIKVLGAEHPSTIYSIYNLGSVSFRQGQYAEAEELFRKALELRVKNLGLEHPDTVSSMEKLELFQKGKKLKAKYPDIFLNRETLALCTKEQALLAKQSDTLLRQELDSDTLLSRGNITSQQKGFGFLWGWFFKKWFQ
jgi:tetratricopeptide (TPR) repeat protein